MKTLSNEKYKNRNPLFIGVVEDNNDPTFNYRVKVRIPNIHTPNITTEQLPWAAKLDCSFMGVGDEQDLNHSIPEVGTKIAVLAIENDINSLVYIGCLYRSTAQTPKNEEYLSNYGIYRKDGQFIGINKIKKLFQMLFDGDIEIDLAHNFSMKVSDNVYIECSNATVKANNVEIDSPLSHFKGDVNVDGKVKAKQTITSDVDCISAGISGKSHTHLYNPGPGGPTPSQPPQ